MNVFFISYLSCPEVNEIISDSDTGEQPIVPFIKKNSKDGKESVSKENPFGKAIIVVEAKKESPEKLGMFKKASSKFIINIHRLSKT